MPALSKSFIVLDVLDEWPRVRSGVYSVSNFPTFRIGVVGAPTFGRFLVQRHDVAIQLAELPNQIACFDAFQALLCENCLGPKCEPENSSKRELRDSHSALRYVRSSAD